MLVRINGLSEVRSMLDVMLRPEKVDKAFRITINRTLDDAKPRIQENIRSVFDRPTNWAINSTWTSYLSANKPEYRGEIRLKDKSVSSSGTPAVNFLAPHIQGTTGRHRKSHEMKMIRAGYMRADQYIVPGPGAKLDSYGNQSKAELNKILASLGLNPTGQPMAGGWRVFLSDDNRTVFAAKGENIKLLWFIVDAVKYSERFDYLKIGVDVANEKLVENAHYAINRELFGT